MLACFGQGVRSVQTKWTTVPAPARERPSLLHSRKELAAHERNGEFRTKEPSADCRRLTRTAERAAAGAAGRLCAQGREHDEDRHWREHTGCQAACPASRSLIGRIYFLKRTYFDPYFFFHLFLTVVEFPTIARRICGCVPANLGRCPAAGTRPAGRRHQSSSPGPLPCQHSVGRRRTSSSAAVSRQCATQTPLLRSDPHAGPVRG
ncbi:uncharacterized protein V1518DRAFT_415750 [Limtongia smithiae]|uniref:uncharacterized protein n=1 Tax=Limtongia smithiae TaxID=1125753 RepID=UPI0034CE517A